MIKGNVIGRVFRIRVGERGGSSFAVEFDGRQYLITVAHLVDETEQFSCIDIWSDGKWKRFDAKLIGCDSNADVAVFALGFQIAKSPPIELSVEGIVWSQDVYFLGFPFGDDWNVKVNDCLYPMPFVKKGILSAAFLDDENKPRRLVIDGYNNWGFSGGPVVFEDVETGCFKIAAIISGYRSSVHDVYRGQTATQLTVEVNSGLIEANCVSHAISLIKHNPIGVIVHDCEN
ncbi:MAG: trypsin-like peptidase domain-containing protein [Acidobacteria bacterium]|nr:trypsin-like peptidase domain-containing protein [Acidobacteriota bacterium]